MTVVVHVRVAPNTVTVPVPSFNGVPPKGTPGQFLAHDNTWQIPSGSSENVESLQAQIALMTGSLFNLYSADSTVG